MSEQVAYGGFLHAVDRVPTGRGYVARRIDPGTRRALDSRNYGAPMMPLRIYRTERGANAWIDRRGR